MKTGLPIYSRDTSADSISQILQSFDPSVTLLFLVAEGGGPDLQQIDTSFASSGFAYAGGLFPKILFDDQLYDSGIIITPLHTTHSPITISGLDDGTFNLQDLPGAATLDNHSLLIILDGLSKHVGGFLRELYRHFGTHVTYFGGGAGSLSLQQTPCVFSNKGLAQDQAVIVPYPRHLKLGVQHGWTRLMGPLIATETVDNVIKQINWQPAFDVYRDEVEQASGQSFDDHEFFDIAKAYPFGLEKHDAEDVVRDPIMVTEKGELVCVGEVPENAIIHILQGRAESLTSSARLAAEFSTEQNKGPIKLVFMVDCVSRILFLEDRIVEEINNIYNTFKKHGCDTHPVGALTLGEISSIGDGYLEFLNKTVVIGSLD
jgi:hypothetical protein